MLFLIQVGMRTDPGGEGMQAAHQDAPMTARAALNPRLSFIRRPPVFGTNRFSDRQ
jgi:hypothetical protein